MITRKTFVGATLLLALAAFGVSMAMSWQMNANPQHLSAAAWKTTFSSAPEMIRGVDAVVLAQAVATKPSRVAASEDGSDSLPFEVTEFTVLRGLKGVAAGEAVAVERAGGSDEKGSPVYLDADGGDFEVGRTYLLFLNRQEEGPYYYQVNPAGRYSVEAGRLKAAVEPSGDVESSFHGRTTREALRLVRSVQE